MGSTQYGSEILKNGVYGVGKFSQNRRVVKEGGLDPSGFYVPFFSLATRMLLRNLISKPLFLNLSLLHALSGRLESVLRQYSEGLTSEAADIRSSYGVPWPIA